MTRSSQRILPLSNGARAQISSSLNVTSHEHVIVGLLENALDAGARSITVHLDLAKGYFSILDDGIGIKEVEFSEAGFLGQANCTSRSASSGPSYGRFGEFLSQLSVLGLLSIVSRHESEHHTNRLVFHRGQVILRQLQLRGDDAELARHGTKVELHNLFADIPVRFRHSSHKFSSPAETDKAFEALRRILTSYLLAWLGSFNLCCSLSGSNQKLLYRSTIAADQLPHFSLETVRRVLSQAIPATLFDIVTWKLVSLRTGRFFIRAAISSSPMPSQLLQFISVGRVPIAKENWEWLYRVINDQFEDSEFGVLSESASKPAASTLTRSRKPACPKGLDRWPMFYIRIEGVSSPRSRQLRDGHEIPEMLQYKNSLARALESLIVHFLASHGFRLPRQGDAIPPRDSSVQVPKMSDQPLHASMPSVRDSAGVPATVQLNQWRRIKHARHSVLDDVGYGLPFATPAKTSTALQEPTKVMSQHCNIKGIGENAIPSPSRENSTQSTDVDMPRVLSDEVTSQPCKNESTPWTDPRTGHIVHIHPRTGATLPEDQIHPSSRIRNHCSPSDVAIASRRVLGIRNLKFSGAVRSRSLNLEPYKVSASFQGGEPPIPAMGDEMSIAFTRGMSSLGKNMDSPREILRVTKKGLSVARTLGQVDEKFILAVVPSLGTDLLLLIDQHAADERIKLEQICQELCVGGAMDLVQPLVFEIGTDEAALIEQLQPYFNDWHIRYTLKKEVSGEQDTTLTHSSVHVSTLPTLIAERCRAEPKLLIDILRHEAWSDRLSRRAGLGSDTGVQSSRQSWLSIAAHCPVGVLDMLKSRACRTAIMFNDVLSLQESKQLVDRLANCDLPFQCAHGRPTLTVAAELSDRENGFGHIYSGAVRSAQETVGFGDAWRSWTTEARG